MPKRIDLDALTLTGDEDTTPAMSVNDGLDDEVFTVNGVEAEALEGANEFLRGFRDRAKQEGKRLEDVTDSEYWVAVCFQTREQKEEFLAKAGWVDLGDKYLDGMQAAKRMGIKLESRIPPMPKLRLDRRLLELVRG